ncbi:pilus assembly protein TadG-related protein [Streptomyces bacillaris]|uniref:pilus assembly protein TadG-related protein n=1 Tax=Streptomyces TaxID=1883 RepID=UPI0036437942
MTSRRLHGDAGQAFPIYVVMVAGLLFLAFAFFAVGKASALRNESQGAADAAALAAAQRARDDFGPGFLASLPVNTLDLFLAAPFQDATACWEARRLASANDARATACYSEYGYLRDKITVRVQGNDPVDSPVIPGTGSTVARTGATALIEFRCPGPEVLDLNSDGVQDLYIFTCSNGNVVKISPASPPPWSTVSKILFDVRLIDP